MLHHGSSANTGFRLCQHFTATLTFGSIRPHYFHSNEFELLQGTVSQIETVTADIKDLVTGSRVRNETLSELHQSGRSIRLVSSHYPIRAQCVRVRGARLRLIPWPEDTQHGKAG